MNKIKKNLIYQIAYQIIILALPLFLSPYVSRRLGAEGLGVYSYSYSIAYYFVLVSMLGILNYGNREIAKVRDNRDLLNREYSSLIRLHIIISFICIIAYFIYTVFISKNKIYAWIQLPFVISGLFDITWFYYGIESFKSIVVRNIIVKILTVILVLTLVKDVEDLKIYCFIMSLSVFISQIILWVPLKKYVSFVIISRVDVIKHLKPMLILFIPTIAVSLYKYMDKIMIGYMSNKIQLGLYENSESIIRVVMSIIGSFGTVMLPQMSNLVAQKNHMLIRKYIDQSMKYIMMMTWGMSFGILSISTTFSVWFWGTQFEKSGIIMQILVLTVPFMAFATVLRTQYLLPFEKDKDYVFSVICGSVINVSFNTVLIPNYGAYGASVATVFAEIAVCVVQTFQVRKELPIKKYILQTFPFFVSGVIMFAILQCMNIVHLSDGMIMIVKIIVGAVLYALMSLCILVKQKDELVRKYFQK